VDETCGGCRFFKVTRERDDGRLGECRLQKVMGIFRDSMRVCGAYARVGGPDLSVTDSAVRRPRPPAGGGEPTRVGATALAASLGGLSAETLKTLLAEALSGAASLRDDDLGRVWTSGELLLVPRSDDVKAKQLSLETHFHKLVMIRENLRVMEQKINSHEHLQDGEKLDLHRKVSRAYAAIAGLGTGFLRAGHGEGPEGEVTAKLEALNREVERDSLSLPRPALGERWRGGEARWTRDGEVRAESIEDFFHRVVLVRDRLLSLEGQVGAHPHIAPDESDAMAAYIRRCYGTLTTFNVLFSEREDYFASAR